MWRERVQTVLIMLAVDNLPFRKAIAELIAAIPGLAVVGGSDTTEAAVGEVVALCPDLLLVDWPPARGPGSVEDGVRRTVRLVRQFCPRTRVALLMPGDNRQYQAVARAAGVDLAVAREDLAATMPALIRTLFPAPSA